VWVAQREGVTSTKYVAIKFIISHHAEDERYSKMFESEAKLSGLLTHSNIVQAFDAGVDQGRAYLVMEWVDGPSLATLMPTLWAVPELEERQRLAGFIIGQLLYGLAYAHKVTTGGGDSLGIVHRDVSPHNVLISISGDVKLTDFGIAHRASEETSGLHVKGKLRYMPREQLSGESRAATVDLFAVGAIFHEMLDGRKFRHDAETEVQMYGAALGGQIPPVQFPVPPELEALRVGLLQPDPKDRIQTAEDALRMLKQWRGNQDMRLELGDLCTKATGITGPRTGLGGTVAPGGVSVAEIAASMPPGTMVLPDPVGAATGAEAAKVDPTMALAGPAPYPTGRQSAEESTATAPHAAAYGAQGMVPETSPNLADPSLMYARPAGNPWPRRIAFGFGGLVAIAMLAVGSGYALIKLTESERTQTAAVDVPQPSEPSTAVAAPSADDGASEGPAGPVIPEPSIAQPTADEDEGEAENEDEAGGEGTEQPAAAEAASQGEPKSDAAPTPEPASPAPKATPKPAASSPTQRNEPSGPPVTVHFRLQEIDAAYVRLNNREYSVTPRHTARLPSGSYSVRWRRDKSESWKRAKAVNIGPDVEWLIRVSERGPVLLDLKKALQ
jgi:hypothetical protein